MYRQEAQATLLQAVFQWNRGAIVTIDHDDLAGGRQAGEVSAAILFAAGRYNAFNFVSTGGTDDTRSQAEAFYVSEYRKAFVSNLEGVVGPVVRPQG